MNRIGEYWKAILGFVAPAATVLVSAVTDPSDGGSTITQAEWVTAACAAVITGGLVAVKGNDPARPTERGAGALELAIGVVVLLIVVVVLFRLL